MLTKSDLNQIGKIVKSAIRSDFHASIGAVRRDLLGLKITQAETNKKLAGLKKR